VLADACWQPAFEECGAALLSSELLEAVDEVALDAGVGLHVALDHVEWGHEGVSYSAGESTPHQTLEVVAVCVGNWVGLS